MGEVIRVADLVAESLWRAGVRDVFMVTGGAAMHLNDAFGLHPGLKVTCFHHEQAAAMAAESYFRMESRPAVVNVTAGPGSTNAITGVLGAWDDSIGMIVLSGQVKRDHLTCRTGLALRQFGDQEVDIVSMVAGITKYAVLADEPTQVQHQLDVAFRLAVSGRPGPVWLDIPVDVQGAMVDPAPWGSGDPYIGEDPGADDPVEAARTVIDLLAASLRPVIFAGAAIRAAGAADSFRRLVARLGVPVVTATNGHDLLSHDDPVHIGRPGIIGDRAGNLAVQNADLVVVLGTRLKIGQVGYDPAAWAPAARVVMVDIDAAEMAKPSIHVDVPLHCDVAAVVHILESSAVGEATAAQKAWLAWCQERKQRYIVCDPQYRRSDGPVNPYVFFHDLFEALDDRAVVVAANSWAGNGTAQAAPIRLGQRLWANAGCGSMGHDLPAAIGAALAAPDRTVVCLAGDGSLQMNIQELQTLVHHQFDLKLFVLDNGGYDSIRQTQARFFPDSPIGFDPGTGISFPDLEKLCCAYDLPYRRVGGHADLPGALAWAQGQPGPIMVHVMIDKEQTYNPKSVARRLTDGTIVSAPLDDMAPFLPAEEVTANRAPREQPDWYRDAVGDLVTSSSTGLAAPGPG